MRALEDQIGTPIIACSRPPKATAPGAVLLKHASQTRLLRAGVERELRELVPKPTWPVRKAHRVSIAIGADCLATWAMPAMDVVDHASLAPLPN